MRESARVFLPPPPAQPGPREATPPLEEHSSVCENQPLPQWNGSHYSQSCSRQQKNLSLKNMKWKIKTQGTAFTGSAHLVTCYMRGLPWIRPPSCLKWVKLRCSRTPNVIKAQNCGEGDTNREPIWTLWQMAVFSRLSRVWNQYL